jgi:HAD superfamily hydrolase (TIGR01509 family)
MSPIAGRRTWFWDLDGTLVDSGPVHEAAFRTAIAEIAPDLLGSFSYHVHVGASTSQVVAGMSGNAEIADLLIRRKQQLYRDYVDAGLVTAFPGAHQILDRLVNLDHTLYLVTSGSRASVERVLAACSLEGYFSGRLTGDDITSSKPNPAVYEYACRRWAVDPGHAVAVEDSAHGVASAVGAGLVTLQVHTSAPAPGARPARHLHEILSHLCTGDERE